MITVQTHQARKELAKLIEEVYYRNERVQILRNKRSMAWLVGDPYMQAIEKLIDLIAERDPEWAKEITQDLEHVLRGKQE